ncbi:M23 family metallopeptidase [Alkalihalobacillus pseudalcaliphilus]|uniref:M23 family metallopeptidase n=1 Tax=Alkalihalobacillus pseudalcaliphilus TaxID=79884 RepID=UPI00064D98D0|nr:M23 family metallopeptidase [Alkalihalobacillus pseudalcaliphilus]KMK74706.1 hypothetical protein AB990_19660 [Alkalihalobacillus pseudalcaliphilus]
MSNRLHDLKKNAAHKRRERDLRKSKTEAKRMTHEQRVHDKDFYNAPLYSKENKPKQDGVIHDKSFLLLRIMISACLFLLVAITYHGSFQALDKAKPWVTYAYEEELQFASIANWYENQFGRPLALLPTKENEPDEGELSLEGLDYAIPASGGVIAEDFSENGHGVLVETGLEAEVKAVKGGFVESVGEDEQYGKRVIVQHYDQTKTIYGMLDSIEVNVYDHIQVGHPIGMVSKTVDEKGQFYFAIQKGDYYIDPSDVISFD